MDREQRGLLAAVWANPADALPRLVYADWLDEHCGEGQPGWPLNEEGMSTAAEYVRLRATGQKALDTHVLERLAELEAAVVVACLGEVVAAAATRPVLRYFRSAGHLPMTPFYIPPRLDVMPGFLTTDGDLALGGVNQPPPSLPAFLRVEGSLNISVGSFTALPSHLRVGRELSIWGTGITALPDDVQVCGQIIAHVGQIDGREAERWLRLPGLSAAAKRSGLSTAGFHDLAALLPPDPTPDGVAVGSVRTQDRQR
jgi:uncharacterized protein (TIGR02996 family)